MILQILKQNTAQRRAMVLDGPISPTILLLSLPTLLMGLVQSAIPVADGLFINNIAGTVAASAVTYCGPIINIFGALAQGLSMAGMAIIGQTIGRGDLTGARRISTQIIVISFLSGFVLAPILIVAAFPISAHVNAEISRAVFVYLALNALVMPFSFMEAIYNAIKNASGKPEATFTRMIIMLVLKILFNALFIAVFRWGIIGAVMASLAANILICAWMYQELFVRPGSDQLSLAGFRFDRRMLGELFRVGFPSMLSTLILNLGFFLINNEVQGYGAVVLNGQGIAGNISTVCFTLPAAFGAAVTTLVSMNIGANRERRARSACLAGCVVSSITAAALIGLVVPLSSRLTLFFTRDPAVLEVANNALHIYTYSVIGFGICMVIQGAFVGLGRTGITLLASILRIWLLRYLFILATESYLSFYAVFWGNLFSNYAAALIMVVLILRVKWVSVITREPAAGDLAEPSD